MERIDQEIDQGAYEWLSLYHPRLVDAISFHLREGASPGQIRRHIQARAGPDREALAVRCEGAARHMEREV